MLNSLLEICNYMHYFGSLLTPKNMLYRYHFPGFLLLCTTLWSCGDDDTNNFSLPASTISLATAAGTSAEGAGIQRVVVRLDQPQAGKTVINFQVDGSATIGASRYHATDVKLLTESPLMIKAGETEAFIEFQALEDQLFEPVTEDLQITLNGVLKGNAVLASQSTYRHLIEENDYELTLSWEAADSVELILLVDQPNSVYLVSKQQSSAEQLLLTDVAPLSDYRLQVWYYQGKEDVRYTLTYRAVDADEALLIQGTFSHDEASNDFDATSGRGLHRFQLTQTDRGLVIR